MLVFKFRAVCIFGLAALPLTQALGGITLSDLLSKEQVATDFNGLESGSIGGELILPGAAFQGGSVIFVGNPAFALEGSDRAWGFFGPGSATIKFTKPVRSVTLLARGSAATDRMGALFDNAPLGEANAEITVFNVKGQAQASFKLPNLSLRSDKIELRNAVGDPLEPGTLIAAVQLTNRSADRNSLVVFGAVGITRSADGGLLADLNGSGCVDLTDLSLVLVDFGGPGGDIDGDGVSTVADISIVLSEFGMRE